ncbi:unnamed protein product [Rotaria socialis]|uniref:G-protein coupled receptors family 3 profile domain-containing protein n=1 Tax=Rotaria socialis TaxID=392032 RepID=A0A817Z591_9BILA|nr:unnamed protein product [Rotaria socialis]CAF3390341.1 unnamed protein product [Rotaria socialis]CAF4363481.1 unnamed protein product [Rotaria socialis]CAF4537925.1 unnamed protein product [Rotaria socialis]
MGTKPFRLFLVHIFVLVYSVLANNYYGHHHLNANRQRITLNGLFTNSHYPSIHFALEQVNAQLLSPINLQFHLDETEGTIKCDVGTSVKTFFDMMNRSSSSLGVIFTDACQTVLSYISETATYFRLPVISFTDSDLSLLAKDRYPYFYHIVPSDHAHNLVRKQLLQYFNWTRFGLIYQHGSKYTLVANDFSNLTAMDKKLFEVNLTRGLAYRHGPIWQANNERYIETLLKDFKTRDVRIIIANFNQTVARHMFCQAAREQVYGSRYQWIILGYPSSSPWWNEPTHCSQQEIVRAMNGTLQTRVPQFSMDENANRSEFVSEYIKSFSKFENDYFDAYAYDTIWSLAYFYRLKLTSNQSNTEVFKNIIDDIDFIGATGRVRYLDGGRIGEVLVEQFVACRMMNNETCTIPCYEEEEDCHLTVVKIFRATYSESKDGPPILYTLNPIMWHGNGPPRDRTNQTVQFEHIYPSVFISISICSGIGLFMSCAFLAFNIHFRSHRYIRMSSPTLNNIILCGCMLAYISMILMGINSSLFREKSYVGTIMNIFCPTRVWILCISFTLAFGSMFSKTWRVHSIFTNINTTKRGIHDSRLLAIVGVLLTIDLIFLIVWQILDPIRRVLVYSAPHRLKDNQDIEIIPYREECKSKNMSLWFVVLVLNKGLLMFYGSFLSWKTRHVTMPALNDSRYIGLSVYIVFICCTLGSLVIFIPSEQMQFSYFLRSFFIVICTTATVCLVFVPKIIEVYRDPHSKKRQPKVTNRLHPNQGRPIVLTMQHLNAILSDNQDLKLVLSMQEETLNRLFDQLNGPRVENRITTVTEPFEMERLIVCNDGADEEDDEDDDDDDDEEEEKEEDSSSGDECHLQFITSNASLQPGRVARAVSLCLFNKVQLGRISWPEAASDSRYSIPSQDIHHFASSSASKTLRRQAYHNSFSIFKNSRNSEHSAVAKDNHASLQNFEPLFDGLVLLDETRLDDMLETDLISTVNG